MTNGNTDNTDRGFSFGGRHEQKVRSDTPAPNQYDVEKCNFSRQPSFTMGSRRKIEKPSTTPGKDTTIGINMRHNLWKMFCVFSVTGPSTYSLDRYNLDHQPAFSFGLRPEQKVNNVLYIYK